MEVQRSRLELALRSLKPSDWERFENLASAFLASEWPDIRTMASSSGDGGRDAEFFALESRPHLAIQYSVQADWKKKIKDTLKRLRETFPTRNILVYVTNQIIGADADQLRSDASKDNIYIDIRDANWFLERANTDSNRVSAAMELCRVIVDPILSSTIFKNSLSILSNQEAKTGLLFLELQLLDHNSDRNLTKSSYEALVRGALFRTTSSSRLTRSLIHQRVNAFVPKHDLASIVPHIDAALGRMTGKEVKYHIEDDSFHISFEETTRLNEIAASVQILRDNFRSECLKILEYADDLEESIYDDVIVLIERILETYLLQKGEEFVSQVIQETNNKIDRTELSHLITQYSPSKILRKGIDNITLLTTIMYSLLHNPAEATVKYLKLLSNSYTLFSFLDSVPDVQRVTKKLFAHGEIWLDTSALLPSMAEEAFLPGQRPFTRMLEQARASGIKLLVTPGVIEEIERHLNRCVAYSRSQSWQGRIPYVYSQYGSTGRPKDRFVSWLEQFRGNSLPLEDIAQWLREKFNIEVRIATSPETLPTDLIAAVREYWKEVSDNRRNKGGEFNIFHGRLAEHDSECCLGILEARRADLGKPSVGYSSWWLTLDSAARNLAGAIDEYKRYFGNTSPVMTLDFLVRYVSFGPNRSNPNVDVNSVSAIFSDPILMVLPNDIYDLAQNVRSECGDLSEQIIQRRIRDALNRERMRVGSVHLAGMDGAATAIDRLF